MYFGGEREKTFNHEYGPIKRTHFIITLVRDGSATLFIDGKELSFGAGDIIIMFPDVEYHYKAHGSWSIKWVGVGSADLGLFLGELGITPSSPIVKCENRERAEELLNGIYNATKSPSPSQVMKLKGHLCELISIIAESREMPAETTAEAQHEAQEEKSAEKAEDPAEAEEKAMLGAEEQEGFIPKDEEETRVIIPSNIRSTRKKKKQLKSVMDMLREYEEDDARKLPKI